MCASMVGKDESETKDTIALLVAATAVSIPAIAPLLALAQAMLGVGISLRVDRFKELLAYIGKNIGVFSEEVLNDQSFQDGFVYLLEQYLRERNEKRRQYMRGLLLGFARYPTKESFPLEKFVHTLSQLNYEDVDTLIAANLKTYTPEFRLDGSFQVYGNSRMSIDSITSLMHLGLLLQDHQPRMGPLYAPYVSVSYFGRQFLDYVSK